MVSPTYLKVGVTVDTTNRRQNLHRHIVDCVIKIDDILIIFGRKLTGNIFVFVMTRFGQLSYIFIIIFMIFLKKSRRF